MIRIILKKNRDESLRRFHPWVFSGAIAQIQGNPSEGDLVAVYSSEGEYLAAGHYQIGSIAVRVLSFDADPSDRDFWKISLKRAIDARSAVGLGWTVTESPTVSDLSTEKETGFRGSS